MKRVDEALLDRVRMTPADREAAKATLRRAEVIADLVYRATQAVQAAVEFLQHGAQVLAQRIRARFA